MKLPCLDRSALAALGERRIAGGYNACRMPPLLYYITDRRQFPGDRHEQEESGYVMAEAEFAGKEKKELAAGRVGMALTLADAVLARLAENLFVRDRPGNAGDGKGQRE